MMRLKTRFFLATFLMISCPAWGEVAEMTRLKGFDNQVREGRQFDKARLSAEKAFLEEEEQWIESRRKASIEFKNTKKSTKALDSGPEADADAIEKKAYQKEQEKNRLVYSKQKESFDRSQHPELVTEARELGLDQERPRYDYKKRASFGASSKLKSTPSAGASTSRGASPNFPPPPSSFDDFGGGDGGFVPAPEMPGDFGDVPPPPPPPPMTFPDEGFGGGADFGNDYIPPPPPPFEGDNSF